jgi:hypothetical protein
VFSANVGLDFVCYLDKSVSFHFFSPMARQPYMGLGLLVSSRLHDHTEAHHSR